MTLKSSSLGKATTFLAMFVLVGCGSDADSLISKGDRLFKEGQFDEAAITFQKAAVKHPSSAEAYYRLGLTELARKKPREAYRALEKAADLAPRNREIQAAYGKLSMEAFTRDTQKSKTLYDRLVRTSDLLLAGDSNDFDGLRIKGQLALLDKRLEDGIGLLLQANRLRASDPELILILSQALYQAGRAEEGESMAEQVIGLRKEFAPIYDSLYLRYLQTNRLAEAERVIRAKAENNPKQPGYLLELADHYHRVRKKTEMEATLKRLLENPRDFARGRLYVGDFYVDRDNPSEGLKVFEEGVKAGGQDRTLYQKRVIRTLVVLNRQGEAEGVLDELLRADPNDQDSQLLKSTYALESRDPKVVDGAVTRIRSLAKEKPESAELQFVLGRALRQKGDLEAAASAFRQSIHLSPGQAEARLALGELEATRGRWQESRRLAEEIVKLRPRDISARILRLRSLAALNSLGEAKAELNSLLRDYPDSTRLRYESGLLLMASGKPAEAEQVFSRLHKRGLEDLRPLLALADALAAQKKFPQAALLLREELKTTKRQDEVRLALGALLARAGRYDDSLAEYRLILASQPQNPDLYYRMAEIHMARKEYEKAVPLLEKMTGLLPSEPGPLSMLAFARMQSGQKAQAKADFRAVLRMRPDDANTMNNLADLMLETGDSVDEALKLAQAALSKAPSNPDMAVTLGSAYLRKNMADSAVQVFKKLTVQYPERPSYHYQLGLAYAQKGDKTLARQAYNAAMAKRPSSDESARIQSAMAAL